MLTLDRNLLHRFGLLLVILFVGLALSLLTDTFLSVANFTNVARQISINGILAVGVTFVLLTAGVDLSLGSVVALSGVACATFAHPGDHVGAALADQGKGAAVVAPAHRRDANSIRAAASMPRTVLGARPWCSRWRM